MSTSARLTAITVGALAGCLLAACSSSSSGHPAAAALPSRLSSLTHSPVAAGASSASSGSSASGSLGKMKMRIVNLYDPKGVAGPALDIYDVQLTGQKATPVAKDVAYGSASAYFTPHVPTGGFAQPRALLFALPAGEDPVTDKADMQGLGGADDDGSHPQITWVLTADNGSALGTGPLARLSFSSRVETGDSNGSKAPVAPPAPAGQGEILVDATSLATEGADLYLMIDASCAPPINGDPSIKGVPYLYNGAINNVANSYSVFPTTPGVHQVSVVSWTQESDPTCAQLKAKQGTTSIDVAAGAQVEAYVYGTSLTNLHLAVAPLAP